MTTSGPGVATGSGREIRAWPCFRSSSFTMFWGNSGGVFASEVANLP